MRKKVRRAGMAVTAAAVACVGLAGAATAPPAALAATGDGRVALPSPVPAWPEFLTDQGPAGADVTASVRVYLAGRSPAAEARFAAAVSTPGNPVYGRYLTPAQFRSRCPAGSARTRPSGRRRAARAAGRRG